MRFVLLALLTAALLGACAAPPPTPTATPIPTSTAAPTPTPTPTFEQRRAEVVAFLKSWNGVANDFFGSVDTVGFPIEARTAADVATMRAGAPRMVLIADGALQRLRGLQPVGAEADTDLLQRRGVALLEAFRNLFVGVPGALDTGGVSAAAAAIRSLATISEQADSIDRLMQTLLARYNIPATDVGYEG